MPHAHCHERCGPLSGTEGNFEWQGLRPGDSDRRLSEVYDLFKNDGGMNKDALDTVRPSTNTKLWRPTAAVKIVSC